MNDREKIKKESRKALKALKKAADKGMVNLSDENKKIVLRLFELRDIITKIEKYKVIELTVTVERLEKQLKRYEDLIDKKYWNKDALFYISFSILCEVYNTVEEAIAGYEEYKKMDK